MVLLPNKNDLRIRVEGAKVTIIFNGRRVFSIPWKNALDFAQGIISQARICESNEPKVAERIISDDAIVRAAGSPFTLSPTLAHVKESIKEAQWGNGRKVPKTIGIPTREKMGTPNILTSPSGSRAAAIQRYYENEAKMKGH